MEILLWTLRRFYLIGMWCCGEAGQCELLVVAGVSPPALCGCCPMGHMNGAALCQCQSLGLPHALVPCLQPWVTAVPCWHLHRVAAVIQEHEEML